MTFCLALLEDSNLSRCFWIHAAVSDNQSRGNLCVEVVEREKISGNLVTLALDILKLQKSSLLTAKLVQTRDNLAFQKLDSNVREGRRSNKHQ